ncbi:hypothetical protein FSP39_010018 [Pinctada imbricata]|uniref:DUF4773 domain-containing protein n=1 Tax=Pinctada imbricata TaxID=66713 RepID=A0AA88XUX2_PINIB|nr:hypothetical protein FSP39_010018 [Pinctada imbricata]
MSSYNILLCLINVLNILVLFTDGKTVSIREFNLKSNKVRSDDSSNPLSVNDNGACSCAKYMCGCCQKIDIETIHLNDTVCANFTYLNKDYGIRVTLSIDGEIYLKAEVSARNPPPICEGIPALLKYGSVCLRFYDMHVSGSQLFGCVRLEFRAALVVVGNITLGCFKIPPGNMSTMNIPLGQDRGVNHKLENPVRTDLAKVHRPQGQRNSGMTKEEKIEFIRRLGLLGKSYTGNGLQEIVVGYS